MFPSQILSNISRVAASPHFVTVVILVTGFVQLGVFPASYLGKEHDDAFYVLASHSLLQGHYRAWFLPGSPPLTQLTPGFPAFLTPIAWLAGDTLPFYQIFNWAVLAAANGFAWLWLRRRHSAEVALVIAFLFALSPIVLSRVGVVMPEPVFLLATMATLLCLERSDRSPWAVGAGLLACFLLRPAALPLIVAAAVSLAAWRGVRDAAIGLILPVMGIALWTFWSRSAGGGVQEVDELIWSYGGQTASSAWDIAGGNAVHLLNGLGSSFLPLRWAGDSVAVWIGFALVGVAMLGAVSRIRQSKETGFWRNADPAALFLTGSLAMHFFWPWWYDRYWLPLLPIFYSFFAEGLGMFCFRTTVRQRRTAILLALLLLWQFLGQGHFWFRSDPKRLEPELASAYAWIRANTSPKDVFASLFYGRDLLYTGRIMGPLPDGAASVSEFRDILAARRQRYVLWQEDFELGFTQGTDAGLVRSLGELRVMLDDASAFRRLYADPGGAGSVFERIDH